MTIEVSSSMISGNAGVVQSITYAAGLTFGSGNGGLMTQWRAVFLRVRRDRNVGERKIGSASWQHGSCISRAEKKTNLGIFRWQIKFAFLILLFTSLILVFPFLILVITFLILLTQSLCSQQ